jgi:hypothetical protein
MYIRKGRRHKIKVEKKFYIVDIVNQADVPDRFRSQSVQFPQVLELLHSFDRMADLTSSLPSVMDESRKGRNRSQNISAH